MLPDGPLGSTPLARQIADFADSEVIVGVQDLSASVVAVTESARSVTDNLHEALARCDPAPIKMYCEQLTGIDRRIRDILKLPNDPVRPA
jgi:hypothetical protein